MKIKNLIPDNRFLLFVGVFLGIILLIIYPLVYKPVSRVEKGRTLQALNPDALPKDVLWSKSKVISELEKERTRRRLQNIYA
tara:strand:- start:1269 stop:1514 length:246 start_codon:yes stop_codon:yes gene_type:complete